MSSSSSWYVEPENFEKKARAFLSKSPSLADFRTFLLAEDTTKTVDGYNTKGSYMW